jgi:LCP family protein required for cell wall assembly
MSGDVDPARVRRRPSRARIALRWFTILVILAVIGTAGYVWFNYQTLESGITKVNGLPAGHDPSKDIDGSAQNILLVGDDHRPAGATSAELAQLGTQEDGGTDNTDSMIVMHIPAGGGKVTLISFPRDSWVNVPGFGYNKLNAAFELGSQKGGDAGGMKLLIETIQNMSGLTINHFVRVSLLGFYNIAEALGPIQVCLNEPVDDPYSTLDLPAGVSTLNAQQALAFVRQRHGLPQGDLDREIRQQYFLSVEAHKILSAGTLLNPVKLNNVLKAVSSSIQTDPGLNLINLAAELHGLSSNNITSATIPVSGTPTITVDGAPLSIVQVDTAAMPAFIQSVVGPPSAYAKAKAEPVRDVTVSVLNGSDTDGVATSNTALLKQDGFKTKAPGSTTTSPNTVIEYPAGMEGAAKALAAYVPGAEVDQSKSVSVVTLVLGTDGVQVKGATPASGAPSSSSAASAASGSGASSSGSVLKSYSSKDCID